MRDLVQCITVSFQSKRKSYDWTMVGTLSQFETGTRELSLLSSLFVWQNNLNSLVIRWRNHLGWMNYSPPSPAVLSFSTLNYKVVDSVRSSMLRYLIWQIIARELWPKGPWWYWRKLRVFVFILIRNCGIAFTIGSVRRSHFLDTCRCFWHVVTLFL